MYVLWKKTLFALGHQVTSDSIFTSVNEQTSFRQKNGCQCSVNSYSDGIVEMA